MISSNPNPPEGMEVHQPSLADEIASEPEPEKIGRLGAAKQFKLMKFMEEFYTSSKLDDANFAVKASNELKFSLNRAHVITCRKALNLPANATSGGNPFSSRFAAVEKELIEQRKLLDIQAARIEELANQLRLVRQDLKTHAR